MRIASGPAARMFGITFRVHFTFPLMFLALWIADSGSGGHVALRAFALTAIVFASVLVHELAHAVVAMRYGIQVRSVILLPITGVVVLDEQAQRGMETAREVRIAISGPLVNLVLAIFFGTSILMFYPQAHLFDRPWLTIYNLPRSLAWTNLLLCVLQLLPAYPLDGGRILRAWFARTGDLVSATRRSVTIGQFFAMGLVFLGGVYSFGRVANSPWVMIAGAFLYLAAQLEDRSMILQGVLERFRVRDVMSTEFATLSPADTLTEALEKKTDPQQDDFPVVRGSEMVGVISRAQIAESLRQEGDGYVQGAMSRDFPVASPHETLAAVMRRLGRGGMSIIPVVENEYLVGIVTFQNLMRKLTALSLRRTEVPDATARLQSSKS